MVTQRSASPEPVATVINDRVGHRLPAVKPKPPTERRRAAAAASFRVGGGSVEELPAPTPRIRAVSFEASSLVDNFSSYKASGPPSRVLYCRGPGAWADFTGEPLASLRKAFEDGRTSVELLTGVGKTSWSSGSVVDFLRMLQTDLGSGMERSIAWIDVHGRCYFPKRAVGDSNRDDPRGTHVLEIDVVRAKSPSPPTMSNSTPPQPPRQCIANVDPFGTAAPAHASDSDSQEEQSGETTATVDVISSVLTTRRWWDNNEAVNDVDRDSDYYSHVERMFLSGIRRVSPDAAVTAIRRCTHAGAHGGARLRAFVAQAQFTKTVREGADANVRAAWYPAATPEEIDGILRYGFGMSNDHRFQENCRYGSGVYLIPPQSMHLHPSTYVLPDPDVNGERHLLLCRTIAGSMERVHLGSQQSHPGADRFDTGVDDPLNPRLHVIWTTKMNTHIIPECVITFRCSGVLPTQQPLTRKPVPARPSWNTIPLTFMRLYAEIRKFVPPSTMRTLDGLLEQYKARKITRDAFIRNMRSVAGTGVLAETIKKFKKHL